MNKAVAIPAGNVGLAILSIAVVLVETASAADGRLQGNPLQTLPAPPPPPAQPAQRPVAPTMAPPSTPNPLAQQLVPRYFDVKGVTAIPFDQVVKILEPLAGKKTTVAELVQEVNKITLLYREKGFPLSFALLQQQSFANGLVQVTVVEGHVSSVRVEGDTGAFQDRLHALTEDLKAERPLTQATLERTMNLLATVPGVRLEPKLDLPRRADGGTELVLKADHTPFSVQAGAADMGLGMQGVVSATTSSLTSLGEQIHLTATVPVGDADVEYYRGAVSIPLGSQGLALNLDAYKYRSTPEDALLSQLGLQRSVRNERASAMLSYPIILNHRQNLTASAGFYATRSVDRYTRMDNRASIALHNDLRVVQAGLQFTSRSEKQSRSLGVNVHQGLEKLGANQNEGSNFDLDFTKFTAEVSQAVVLPASFGALFQAAGQYSKDSLVNSERVAFGASRFGLGYPAGELAGDSGWGTALELNYGFKPNTRWIKTVQPYARADYARAYQNTAAFGIDDRRLSSVGVGIRFTDDKYYALDLNVAKPTGARPYNDSDRSLRFNASYSLRYD